MASRLAAAASSPWRVTFASRRRRRNSASPRSSSERFPATAGRSGCRACSGRGPARDCCAAAKFGQPEVKLGTIPGYGGTQRLPRLIGKGRALQLLLSGDMIDAHEALRIGLVNRVVPAAELLSVATTMLQQILANGPLAVAQCIDVVNRGLDATLDDALALEATAFGALAGSHDMREGTRAFLEKRAPAFSGA